MWCGWALPGGKAQGTRELSKGRWDHLPEGLNIRPRALVWAYGSGWGDGWSWYQLSRKQEKGIWQRLVDFVQSDPSSFIREDSLAFVYQGLAPGARERSLLASFCASQQFACTAHKNRRKYRKPVPQSCAAGLSPWAMLPVPGDSGLL
jgi:hypothetical protein